MTAVGVAVRTVDVPAGTSMAGFAARSGPSTGVHDPLEVRALSLDGVCFVTVDVCGLHEDTCAEIADRAIADRAVAEQVRVSATHTHSGPCVVPGRLGGDTPELRRQLVEAAVSAADEASRSAAETPRATLAFVSGPVADVAFDRRHGVGLTVDVQALLAHRDGAVVASLVTFPCHPVVLGADNLLVSGDYPAALRTRLEARWPGATVLFATGCAGDVNTGHTTTSSHAEQPSPRRTFAEADRIADVLAEALPVRPTVGDGLGAGGAGATVTSAHTRVRLDLESLERRSPAELATRWQTELPEADPGQAALLRSWIGWAAERRPDDPLTWSAPVGVTRLSGGWVVTLPGEPFLAAADALRAELGEHTLVLGYTDGCPGYFPTAAAYPEGGYEVLEAYRYYGMPAPFAAGSAERLVAAVLALARELE